MGPRNQYYNKLLSHQSVKLNHLLDLDEVGHISFHQEWANMFGAESNCHENDDLSSSACFELPTLKSTIIVLQAEENSTELLHLPHPYSHLTEELQAWEDDWIPTATP